ncbi:hypothetical protein GJU39_10860 [Pedobacter petrophilus]|uniref:DUF6985 domain-containing protein n=1 Tax=Pedobacter petrophilus TaxID=1908241 RepID=A0A7K0FYY8_9SPHI|nr:hypothetical protein [Pedobacter petrophilus]MRX76592.1 hypothetical protein [Pedobacter petrophilus]
MTGWEIENPGEYLIADQDKILKTFIKTYPLSALSPDGEMLLIIRKYHPLLNCSPDDSTNPSDSFRICLAYYTVSRYFFFELPTHFNYNMLSIRYDQNIQDVAITISSREMTRVTNIKELFLKLESFTPKTEAEKEATFASLTNEIPPQKKRIPIIQTEVTSTVIGTLKNADFDDWWVSEPQKIGFLDNVEMKFTITDYHPVEDESFMEEADETIRNFLAKTFKNREAASAYVYQNCMDFLDAIGYDEADQHLWDIKDPKQIWNYATPREIYITREPYEDKGVYLRLIFYCEWEQEHGLQLVFNQKGKLVRVSEDDGHILGWQGHGMIADSGTI